jgi:hypothetical protein
MDFENSALLQRKAETASRTGTSNFGWLTVYNSFVRSVRFLETTKQRSPMQKARPIYAFGWRSSSFSFMQFDLSVYLYYLQQFMYLNDSKEVDLRYRVSINWNYSDLERISWNIRKEDDFSPSMSAKNHARARASTLESLTDASCKINLIFQGHQSTCTWFSITKMPRQQKSMRAEESDDSRPERPIFFARKPNTRPHVISAVPFGRESRKR